MSRSERPVPLPTGTGPSENAAARKPLSVDSSARGATVHHLPLSWAQALIQAANGRIPIYGSPEFHRLPDGPVKVASCVQAAELWRTRDLNPAAIVSFTGSRRQREIGEAAQPRPGDHPGGAVPLWEWDEVASD